MDKVDLLQDEQKSAPIHLGASSWTFEGWRGVFYPDRLPKTQHLAYYIRQFDTVEVNAGFYAIPTPATLLNWVESALPGFTYALKAPRLITHERRLVDCEAPVQAFLDALRALGEAAAPALFQFPPDFTRKLYGRVLAAFLDRLAVEASGLRLAVEVRAADLMTPAFARFLAERGFALALADREKSNDLFEAWLELIGAGAPSFAYIRWIGDDRNGPRGDRELQVLRDEQLVQWAARIETLVRRGVEVFGYMHNTYEGHSPASLRRLQNLLAPRIPLPVWPPAPPKAQLSML
ncbi:MAG: DUF72 domain-containing protein [Caldilinea sp.]|nr:DUF72 domain-containing protein [Caldilinea sp.]MDW8442077.1 DUF72 domain-containing protein [Caldilineaceae bacterium]